MNSYWKMFVKRWELILISTALLSVGYVALDATFWCRWWLRPGLRFIGFLFLVLAFANLIRLAKSVWVNTSREM